jgi:hypothetical protein
MPAAFMASSSCPALTVSMFPLRHHQYTFGREVPVGFRNAALIDSYVLSFDSWLVHDICIIANAKKPAKSITFMELEVE